MLLDKALVLLAALALASLEDRAMASACLASRASTEMGMDWRRRARCTCVASEWYGWEDDAMVVVVVVVVVAEAPAAAAGCGR